MSFVNVWLLGGSALITIPIVLHLVMRRKPRRFEFPALRFLQKRHDVNQRRLRLRHLLLLLLRALAIVLLAAALARPSVKFSGAFGSQEAPVAAALVFDTSLRMDYQHENRTRLEAAREWGLWLLTQLPRESQIAVLETSPGPVAFQVDRGAAKHRLERLATTANSRPLSATLDEAVRLLDQSALSRREIFVFTDMARVSWPSESADRWRDLLARMPDVGVYLIDVGVEDPTNSALGVPRLSAQVLPNRSPLEIETEVYHQGAAVERTVELYLLEQDPEDQEARGRTGQKTRQQTVELESGQAQRIAFQLRGLEVGTHQGYVDLGGADGLACDDRRFFTVEVKPAWRVLLASPRPTAEFTLFVTQMLAPAPFVRSGEARFDCNVVALDELPQHSLEPYAAVFLVNPTPPPSSVWRKLGRYVAGGGGLALLLGQKAGSVESFNGAEAQKLLPAKLLRHARAPRGQPYYLAPQEFQHPILAELREYADSIPWQELPVFRYWQLDKLAPGTDVVVPFNDGQPAILERPVDKGRVVTVTTPISDDLNENAWNWLPNPDASWPTLSLVNGIGSYLAGASDEQLNYFAGQTAALRLDPERTYRDYVLTPPHAPEGAEIQLAPDPEENVLATASTDAVGNYRLRPRGGPPAAERGFSVNLALQQTRLDRLAEEDLADVFGPVPHRVARRRSQLESVRSMQRVGRELFPALIFLLAVALGVEHLLANRFYKE